MNRVEKEKRSRCFFFLSLPTHARATLDLLGPPPNPPERAFKRAQRASERRRKGTSDDFFTSALLLFTHGV
jgi:hypothetical protein